MKTIGHARLMPGDNFVVVQRQSDDLTMRYVLTVLLGRPPEAGEGTKAIQALQRAFSDPFAGMDLSPEAVDAIYTPAATEDFNAPPSLLAAPNPDWWRRHLLGASS